MTWIQILILGLLYLWVAFNLKFWETETNKEDFFGKLVVIILRYTPVVFLTIQYVLIYY